MLFPTFEFAVFFAVFFPIYWLLPIHGMRMVWLLAASAFFYLTWNPWLILLILFSASVDYLAALEMERIRLPSVRLGLLVGSIGINVGLLAYFKYANFFLDTTRVFASWWAVSLDTPTLQILLPLGISFYTFETISYITDVYLGRTKAVRSPIDYAIFILFFPHLVAGPIVRSRDFLPQIQRRKRWNWLRAYVGVRLFLMGLIKKAVFADHLAAVVDPVFQSPTSYGTTATWLAVVAYSMQIYFDFSGYSEMAVGLAHLLGFKLPQNFRFPYLAVDVADFWKRWHISLSSWLRDYLYIPLGGNRFGSVRTYANLILVMVLGGLWHGASWTFIAWGLWHGIGLAIHRAVPWPSTWRTPSLNPFWIVATFTFVSVGWVFFRAQSFTDVAILFSNLTFWTVGETQKRTAALLVLVSLGFLFMEHTWMNRSRAIVPERAWSAPLVGAGWGAVGLLALLAFPHHAKTFIYFQF